MKAPRRQPLCLTEDIHTCRFIDMQKASGLFRLLGDTTRLRLLRVLDRDRFNVTELTGILSLAQSGVSRHLSLLRDAGLVIEEREGGYAYYRLRRDNAPGTPTVWPLLDAQFVAADDTLAKADDAHVVACQDALAKAQEVLLQAQAQQAANKEIAARQQAEINRLIAEKKMEQPAAAAAGRPLGAIFPGEGRAVLCA